MEPIRILLVDMPRLLREIVNETLSAQSDMHVVAECEEHSSMRSAARESNVQIVIVGSDGEEIERACEGFAVQHPNVGVLSLSADGRHTVVYELRPHPVALGELSPHQLVRAIHDAAQARAGVA